MTQPKNARDTENPAPRRNRTGPVGDDAGRAAATAFRRAGFTDPSLVLRWDEIAGPEIAGIARPIRLNEGPSGGVLTLQAEPGSALFLQHETRTLTERINAYLGREAVVKLRFVQGPVRPRPEPKRRAAPPDAAPPDDPVRSYRGPERLRAALLELARQRRRPPG